MTSNHLGEYIKARRLELGLGRGDVARLFGYTNLNKACRRLCDIEDGRRLDTAFLVRLTKLLGIEPQVVQELIDQDREEFVRQWEKWADEPVPIQIAVRWIPGFIAGIRVPDDVRTPEQAVAYGQALAAEKKRKVFVTLTRRLTVGIRESGEIDGRFTATPDDSPSPFMELSGKKFLVHFDASNS